MVYVLKKESYFLGVYVSCELENPDSVIRAALHLESERVLTPDEMMSPARRTRYVLKASDKMIYFSSFTQTTVHVFLADKVYVKVRCLEPDERVDLSIEETVKELSEGGLEPVDGRELVRMVSKDIDMPNYVLL